MADSVYVNFPSQVVSDLEKMSPEYGLKVAKAIEQEWFRGTQVSKYIDTNSKFHNLRLYARGEQPVQKYKDELSINGDLSYLNLDWKPVPIVSKFVDIVVNGMSERMFNVKAYSQDQYGVSKRTEYMESILRDMKSKEFNDFAADRFNMNLYENDKEILPDTEEELALHMQLNYKQAVELAEEQAIDVLLQGNKYDLTRRRLLYDLTVLGIACVKTRFDFSEGVTVDYVDPVNIVYSYTESPYFDDLYYIGEVKTIPINELVKQFPNLTNEDLEEIQKTGNYHVANKHNYKNAGDKNKIQLLYFNYKTYTNDVYKLKEVSSGAEKIIQKDDSFNPPESKEGGYHTLVELFKDEPNVNIIKGANQKDYPTDDKDYNEEGATIGKFKFYDSDGKLWVHEGRCKDGRPVGIGSFGQMIGMRIGIEKSSAKYICHIGADVVFLNKWVDKLLPLLDKNKFIAYSWRYDVNHARSAEFSILKRETYKKEYFKRPGDLIPNMNYQV